MKIQNDVELFIVSRWMYSIGEPIISDAEYTRLLHYITEMNLAPEYTNRSWSSDPCPVDLLNKYGYSDAISAVVLADKTESIPSLTTELEVFQEYQFMDTQHFISYKHDGFNVQTSYYNGEYVNTMTRGRKSDALDVSVIKSLFPAKISKMGSIKIICELTISDSNFKELQQVHTAKKLISQRSAVRTALANPEYIKYLSVTAFAIQGIDAKLATKISLLEEWGFATPCFTEIHSYAELQKAIRDLGERRDIYGQPTDGLVVADSNGEKLRAIRINEWEEGIYQSYVTGYEESFGTQEISMKALIRPVRLKNSVQRKVAVTNLARVIENELYIGLPIAFTLTSDAVAVLDENTTRLLHLEFGGKESLYIKMIEASEQQKGDYEYEL